VSTWLDESASERFGDVKREQQRQPLARAAIPAEHAGRQQRQRQRLQHQPGSMRGEGREHELPQRFECRQRKRAGDRESLDAAGRVR
jgi:hypothetical protein